MAPRLVTIALLALLASACGEEAPAGSGGAADVDLVVRVDRDGGDGPKPARRIRVRCAPGDASRPCRVARALDAGDFAPVDARTACTELYGGPETARVTGVLDGRRVAADFSRNNGCEIARWERVAKLLDQGS
jgi:hypothetical protein